MDTVRSSKYLVAALFALGLLLPSCTLINPGTFAITSPAAGLQSRSNVIRVEGSVVRHTSAVMVNGQEARIENGKFLAFIEMNEGDNNIEAVAQVDGRTLKDNISVYFSPPLAVFMGSFMNQTSPDRLNVTGTMTGVVSRPDAAVTVNGQPATVAADGTYTAQLTLSLDTRELVVVATFGEDKDIARQVVFASGTTLSPGPGQPIFTDSTLPDFFSLTRGKESSFEYSLGPIKNIQKPKKWTFVAPGVGGGTVPAGLSVKFFPDTFTLYPNAIYPLMFSVTVTKEFVPGTYNVPVDLPYQGQVLLTLEVR